MGSPLLELPLETLTEIVKYAGNVPRGDDDPWIPNRTFWALVLTCRDLHKLTEDLAERRIKKIYGSWMSKILSKRTTVQTSPHRKSIGSLLWTSKLCLSRFDLRVFGPRSVSDRHPDHIANQQEKPPEWGPWRIAESQLWGTVNAVIGLTHFRRVVPTVVSRGRYSVWLDFSWQSDCTLRSTRFFVADTPGVNCYWMTFIPDELYNYGPTGRRYDLTCNSIYVGNVQLVKVYVGTLVVSGEAFDNEMCKRIEFVIEDEDYAFKHLWFNCVQFERMSDPEYIEGEHADWYRHPRPPAIRNSENTALRPVMSAFHDVHLLHNNLELCPTPTAASRINRTNSLP